MKKLLFTIVMGLLICDLNAQKLEQTSHIWISGTADDFRQGYVFSYESAGTPWNGSLISYGGFTNNYDTQISSDYWRNRISFRTRNGDANFWNPWLELATRGTNDFIGNQSIEGNLGIGTTNPSNIQGWSRVLDVAGIHDSKILATSENGLYKVGIFSHNENWYGGGGFVGTESNHPLHFITNYTAKMSVLTNGNVGIGTTKPDSKLTVAGNIHAQEVKVTVNAGADFVFDEEYNLPSLESVDKFIKENKHLPEIASASQMQENGINLSEMNIKLLQKIEEMTLYIIAQNKSIQKLSLEVKNIKENCK